MENAETIVAVCIFLTGGITSFLISFLKRYIEKPTHEQIRLITAGVSFLTTVGLLLLMGNITWQGLGVGFASILGVSQIVYFGVMKTLNLDKFIENE